MIILKDGAVPKLTDYDTFCRICLTTSGKLISTRKYKLDAAFEEVTGISFASQGRLPRWLCVECAHRLVNCNKFRRRALIADSLVKSTLQEHDCITVTAIQSIKETQSIIPSLSIKHYPPDHFNLSLVEGEEIKNEVFLDIEADHYDDFTEPELKIEEESYEEMNTANDALTEIVEEVKPVKRKAKEKDRKLKKGKKAKDDMNGQERDEESLFVRTELTYEQQVAELMKRKETDNYKNSVLKCNNCYKGFFDKDAYKLHMTRHTNLNGKYHCEICKTHFKLKSQVRNHVNSVHSRQYSCRKCDYVVCNKESAKCHERWHKGTKYTCSHCQEEFDKRSSYFSHVRIKHPSEFACQYCGYSYVSQKGVKQHILFKHRQDNPDIPDESPLCELCDIRFASPEALKRHKSVSPKHTIGIPTRNDPTAGKKKYNKPRPKGEIETMLACEQCGVQLKGSREYHNHFRSEHPDKNRTVYPSMKSPAMCEVCGKMFQNAALLTYHMWMHKEDKCFECDHCGKQFQTKYRLVMHMEMHSGHRRTYTCGTCRKQFSWKSNLNKHILLHTGVKPYACEICGKAFRVASERRAHVDYVHIRKAYPKKNKATRHRARIATTTQTLPPPGGSEMNLQSLWPCDNIDLVTAISSNL